MKTNIDSSRRTLWFKIILVFITCLSFVIIPSCQKDESDQEYLMKSIDKNKKPKFKQEVIDVDGNIYSIVKIGNQLWMEENLRTTKYNDGTAIQLVTDNAEWINLTTPAYCWYFNNFETYGDKFGAIYNGYAANKSNICPVGWHVPSFEEINTLLTFLIDKGYGFEGSGIDIAKSMASVTDWITSTRPGTPGYDQESNNGSGFNALPAGIRTRLDDGNGIFIHSGVDAYFWNTSESVINNSIRIRYSFEEVSNFSYAFHGGMSIRCLQD